MRHLSIVLWALLVVGCHRPAPTPAVAPPSKVATYEARGVVRKIDRLKLSAVIAHDEIPGYMAAMAMELEVAEARELDGLQPGDVVTFRLSVDETRSWIDRLQKVGTAVIAFPAPSELEIVLPPDTMAPDCTLTDSAGRRFQVSGYRGRVLVVSFIFTRCPLPDFCPRVSTRLAELPAALTGAGDQWHMLSVSFDPEFDTAERLAAYAARFKADSARWTFASGQEQEVLRFGAAFGLTVQRAEAGFEHNLRTVVIDPVGRVHRILNGNQWTTADLAAEVRKAMSVP